MTEKHPKRLPKTLKEKRFVAEYLKTGNATEAASRVYDVSNRNSANSIGSENLLKLGIADILDRAGATDDKIAKTINDGMESIEGPLNLPDTKSRLKAAELASKIKGHLKERIEHTGKDGKPLMSFTDFVMAIAVKNESSGNNPK